MVAIKKKGLALLSEQFYSLFGTCVKSNRQGPWNLKMWFLKVLEKSLNFMAEKVFKPWIKEYTSFQSGGNITFFM